MSEQKQTNSTFRWWIILIIVLLLGAAIYFFIDSRRAKDDMKEMVEQMMFEKEQLEDEYQDLAIQFDGYGNNIQNDSLADLLHKEQQRVQDLLEELRITKATNAKRIAELKKELATVRAVMVQYVHQIDSLDRRNQQLTKENREVKQQYQQVSQRADELEQEKSRLTEVVTRASMMEVQNFSMLTLNEKGRTTKRYNQIQKLQFNYTILKNITATPGQKTVYLRIVRPDGEVMQKSSNNTFKYENQQIEYSIKKDFEYDGDELSDVMYWTVEEILQIGTYNADFFIDGALCGSFPFSIKK